MNGSQGVNLGRGSPDEESTVAKKKHPLKGETVYLVVTSGMEYYEVHDVYAQEADAKARADRLNEGYRKEGLHTKWLMYEADVVPMQIL